MESRFEIRGKTSKHHLLDKKMHRGTHLLSSCYSYNKFRHKVVYCRSKMNQNVQPFLVQCYTCNRFGHKASEKRESVEEGRESKVNKESMM